MVRRRDQPWLVIIVALQALAFFFIDTRSLLGSVNSQQRTTEQTNDCMVLNAGRLPAVKTSNALDEFAVKVSSNATKPTSLIDSSSFASASRPQETSQTKQHHDLFHFILTSPNFDWKFVLAIDRLFFHHRDARVILHSNSDDLRSNAYVEEFNRAGYRLEVRPYDLGDLLRQACSKPPLTAVADRARAFIQNLTWHEQHDRYWTNNESNLLRCLMVYQHGGVYLDMDMYMQRPIPWSIQNAVGYEDKYNINNAALIFESEHPFMAAAISEIMNTYTSKDPVWGAFGPRMMTRLFKESPRGAAALPSAAFQPIPWNQTRLCYDSVGFYPDISGAYAIHINNKHTKMFRNTTKGTLCHSIFNFNCLLYCGHETRLVVINQK